MKALYSFCFVSVVMALLLVVPRVAFANAPPPWHSCEERIAGDTCDPYGGDTGICTPQPDCSDDPDTALNECLWCDATDDGGCNMAKRTGSAGAWAVLLGCVLVALHLRRRRR